MAAACGICKGMTLHPIDNIMVIWNGQTIFSPIVDVGVVVYPLLVNNIVKLAVELPAPCEGKEKLAPKMQERRDYSQPVW